MKKCNHYDKNYKLLKKSPYFNVEWYLKQNPDVQQVGANPILHYLENGWKENRNPSPLFDTHFYLSQNEDVKNSGICPLLHYLKFGKKEGRTCCTPAIPQPIVSHKRERRYSKLNTYTDKIHQIKYNTIHKKPFFSIIVASYNYEQYISKTLDSLLAQTYPYFEIIVVDDGSKDNSLPLIKKYAARHQNIKLYTHPDNKNKGLPATVQLGIQKSAGDFVAFCESDDYWTPNHLTEIYKLLCRYPTANIISNDVELFDNITPEMKNHLTVIQSLLQKTVNQLDFITLPYNPIPTFSAVAVRKSILEKCNFNSFVISAWLDWWLWRQILVDNPLYYLPEKLTCFRIHTSYNSKDKLKIYETKTAEFLLQNNLLIVAEHNRNKLIKRYFTHKKKYHNIQILNKINKSGYFNEKWYINTYPEALFSDNALKHYLEIGWRKGFNPSKKFNTKKYLNKYPDVQKAQVNPLVHYIAAGQKEGRMAFSDTMNRKIYAASTDFDTDKTILLVTHELNYTGAPMLLLSVAQVLQKTHFNVILLSPSDGALKKEFLKNNVTVIIDADAFVNENAYLAYQKMGITFCLFNTYLNNPIYRAFAPHIPSILWIHENLLPSEYYPELINTFKESKDVYVPSMLTKKHIENHVSDKSVNLKQLPYPIKDNVIHFTPKKVKDVLNITLIAAIQPRKGQDLALNAIKSMDKNMRKQIKLTFIGAPTIPTFAKQLYADAMHIPEVSFQKVVQDRTAYHQLYDNTDILLCPSREDPYPLVVIDALMHGVPVIVSDHVGQKDIIQNGHNGYVFKSENTPELADIIQILVQNKHRLSAMSQNARQTYLNHFDFNVCAKELKKIVEGKCKKSL